MWAAWFKYRLERFPEAFAGGDPELLPTASRRQQPAEVATEGLEGADFGDGAVEEMQAHALHSRPEVEAALASRVESECVCSLAVEKDLAAGWWRLKAAQEWPSQKASLGSKVAKDEPLLSSLGKCKHKLYTPDEVEAATTPRVGSG